MTSPYPPYQSPMQAPRPQGFQFTNPQPPVFQTPAPKKSHKGILIAVGVLMVLLVGIGVGSAGGKHDVATVVTTASAVPGTQVVPATVAATTAAPTTAAPTVTVTAAPKDSANLALLKATWPQMSATQQEKIRTPWAQYKDSPILSAVFVDTSLEVMQDSLPTLTRADLIAFLDWTLDN